MRCEKSMEMQIQSNWMFAASLCSDDVKILCGDSMSTNMIHFVTCAKRTRGLYMWVLQSLANAAHMSNEKKLVV